MSIYLKRKIKIRKPIVFLCGSIYKKIYSDKRHIFKLFIENELNNNVHVLIIDDFLNKERLEDGLNIKVFEEIFSSIAAITYVFVESFSSVAELGLFTNSKNNSNNVIAIIPKEKNLLNNKIGYFVKEIILDVETNDSIIYNPKVIRFAYGTDYVDEHYYFYDDKLPKEIQYSFSQIKDCFYIEHEIVFSEYNNKFLNSTFYNFQYDLSKKLCYLDEKTLFYLVSAFIERKFTQSKIVYEEIKDTLIDEIYLLIQNSISESLYYYTNNIDIFDISIINNNAPAKEFIKYVIHFNKYFYQHLLNIDVATERKIIKFDDLFFNNLNVFFKKAKHIFEFDYENFTYTMSKKQYIRTFNIFNNKKVRKIITYKDIGSNNLKYNHILINKYIRKFLEDNDFYSECSFAYKKGLNTLQCVECHLNSKYFLKLDIEKFFESIKYEFVVKKFYNLMSNKINNLYRDEREKEKFLNIIKKIIYEASYNDSFPIGFITSPIISDLSMIEFDKNILDILYKIDERFIYTRYADDILVSLPDDFDKQYIYSIIKDELKKNDFMINEKKLEKKNLLKQGDYIRFVGLNIVFDGRKNSISLGKKFIKELAKSIVYNKHKSQYEINKNRGLVNYLKYNDKQGYKKLEKIINIYKKRN